MTEPIQLGPFTLEHPLAAGGMGEVWRGRHQTQGIPVAVKVITGGLHRTGAFLNAFQREVQALASLDHPAIVMVFDQGVIDGEAERASGGRLVAGSPYLVMELGSLGSLDDVVDRLEWPQIRALLMSVLSALAHAHARDVIHRDLKPGNIILCAPSDTRVGPKLSDFGLAFLARQQQQQGSLEQWMGTPLYMAPEQCEGRFRDYGPWTDLYAVGCLTYELVCGRPPFLAANPYGVLTAHLQSPAPPLMPRIDVPRGLAEWCAQLLQKSVSARYRRAADAAYDLTCLGEPSPAVTRFGFSSPLGDAPERPVSHARPELDTRECGQTLVESTWDPPTPSVEETYLDQWPGSTGPPTARDTWSRPRASGGDLPSPARRALDSQPQPSTEQVRDVLTALQSASLWPAWDARNDDPSADGGSHPPLPRDWAWSARPGSAPQLWGVGLNLFGLRTLPLVDRHEACAAAWSALLRAHDTGRAQALILGGGPGFGKSRLAQWIAQYAHQIGAATVLRATHSPSGGAANGLARMLALHLKCVGLPWHELRDRVAAVLAEQGVHDTYQVAALTEILRDASAPQEASSPSKSSAELLASVTFSDRTERYAVIRHLLEHMCQTRPVLVWLDDVQWGADALGLTSYLLERQSTVPLPILFVLTVRDDILVDRGLEQLLLKRLAALEGTREIEVGPLPKADQRALVRQLLELDDEVSESVEAWSTGNPLFAIQLVGDWVERGALEPGRRGFRLAEGARVELPDDTHSLWDSRIDHLLQWLDSRGPTTSSAVVTALYLAAALGVAIDDVEWRHACAVMGLDPPGDLVLSLAARRLAHVSEHGWRFAHATLRESLKRRALSERMWHPVNRACAHMLAAVYQPDERSPAWERIARHQIAAGELEAALLPLLEGAKVRAVRSAFESARTLMDTREKLLDQLGIPSADRRRCEGWVVAGYHELLLERDLEAAATKATRAGRIAQQQGWLDLFAQAQLQLGQVAHRQGRLDEAVSKYDEALELFDRLGDPKSAATCLDSLVACARRTGDFDLAWSLNARARAVWDECGDELKLAGCLVRSGAVALDRRAYDEAERTLREALAIFERHNNQLGIAACMNNLAEVQRSTDDLPAAEASYEMALACYEAIDSGRAVYPRLNLCLIWITRGLFDKARRQLDALLSSNDGRIPQLSLNSAIWLRLPCLAATEEWGALSDQLDVARTLLENTKVVLRDDVWALQRAGELAAGAGRSALARRCLSLARECWTQLDASDEIHQVTERLAALPIDDHPAA